MSVLGGGADAGGGGGDNTLVVLTISVMFMVSFLFSGLMEIAL
jgi:hypothetical protein